MAYVVKHKKYTVCMSKKKSECLQAFKDLYDNAELFAIGPNGYAVCLARK